LGFAKKTVARMCTRSQTKRSTKLSTYRNTAKANKL